MMNDDHDYPPHREDTNGRHHHPHPPPHHHNPHHNPHHHHNPHPPPSSVMSGSIHPPPSTKISMNTDPTPGAHVTEINLNIGYFKTVPGIIKIIQLILGIVCMACASPARGRQGDAFGVGHNHWFLFVVVTAFIITLLWTFFYFLQMRDSVNINHTACSWLKLEYFYTIITTILYFIAFIVILSGFGYCAGGVRSAVWCNARVAAGVFAIFNTIAYAIGAFLLHNDYKATPPELQ